MELQRAGGVHSHGIRGAPSPPSRLPTVRSTPGIKHEPFPPAREPAHSRPPRKTPVPTRVSVTRQFRASSCCCFTYVHSTGHAPLAWDDSPGAGPPPAGRSQDAGLDLVRTPAPNACHPAASGTSGTQGESGRSPVGVGLKCPVIVLVSSDGMLVTENGLNSSMTTITLLWRQFT